uniref:Uncharacterized protein n=1 Tax=Anguilla anguilla TaxID=7936 RepID=A0A0E9V3X7_ANGAN
MASRKHQRASVRRNLNLAMLSVSPSSNDA